MNDAKKCPPELTAIILISSWMTYRIAGLPFLSGTEAFGGAAMASAWVVPLGQDALIGLTAPFVVYLIATRPRVATYAIAAAWLWWGIADFVVGLVVGSLYPPMEAPFGPHTPPGMLDFWLYANLAIEIVALALLARKDVRYYFMESQSREPIALSSSPFGGRWVVLLVAAGLMGVFFERVALMMDSFFALFS